MCAGHPAGRNPQLQHNGVAGGIVERGRKRLIAGISPLRALSSEPQADSRADMFGFSVRIGRVPLCAGRGASGSSGVTRAVVAVIMSEG